MLKSFRAPTAPALCLLVILTFSNTVRGHVVPGPDDTHPGSSCADEGPFGLPGLSGSPDQIGQWGEVLDWPVTAIHMTLMHTGKILFWRNARPAYVFDPLTEEITATSIPGPESPEYNTPLNGRGFLFCDGHTTLADGRVLAAGGSVVEPDGLPDAYIYDPDTGEWSTTGFMELPRYYPTLVTLLDGRVLVHGGEIDSQQKAIFPEVFDPGSGQWNTLYQASSFTPFYPRLHALPDGIVLNSGPYKRAFWLDVDAETWTAGPFSTFETVEVPAAGSPQFAGTMYRLNKIFKIGGYDSTESAANSLNRVELLDMGDADPQWREITGMAYGRRRANSVILPDGDVLIVGGAVSGQDQHECAVHALELWDPDTEQFTTLASQQRPRVYHSTALLLPDGRVLSASGENSDLREENAEIYSPPYLFMGPRPTIGSVPTEVSFAHDFVISTPDAAVIDSVVLIRPGSVTHQNDMNQRYVPLQYTVVGNEIHATAPPNSDAPPGYYMLFILSNGVPSVAPMLKLTFDPLMDTDGDGLPDNFEDSQGFDKYDPADANGDFDNDTLTNLEEFTAGSKPKNADWDHDDLDDPVEFAAGTDPNDADTDSDGMPDGWEILYGLDPLDPADAALDGDGDLLTSLQEFQAGSDPNVANNNDDDDDGLPNDWEMEHGLDPNDPGDALIDSDGDGLNNLVEFQNGSNPLVVDSDGDTLTDLEETGLGTNPASADSDADGVDDATEISNGLNPLNADDSDGDEMPNDYEMIHGLDPDDPADGLADRDGDGLLNTLEFQYRTDLDNPDTDGDGLSDAAEVLVDFEARAPTDPLDPDSDDDGMPDGFEVDNNLDANFDNAGDDPDNDMLHNYGEFRLGGDPNNSASPGHTPETAESFEAGLPAGWEAPAGAIGWLPDSGAAAAGSFSLTSASIGDSAIADIVVPLFVHDSLLRFDYFVSSASGDLLQVYLDGELLFATGGNVDWTTATDIPLLEGFHEVRFAYSKDAAGQSGCDCARIDNFEHAEYPLDMDGDGVPGAWEDQYGFDRNDPNDVAGDTDGDGLSELREFENGTHPFIQDTDGDLLTDGYEVNTSQTDPTRQDTDSDQLSDSEEIDNGTNPNRPDWPMLQESAENPGTEAKRVLGKILFWEEQLSSDDTVACGTCHMSGGAGGGDPRIADPHPGLDGLVGTADDILGSPGVVHRDAAGDPVDDPVFGLLPQVTRRNSPSIFVSMFARELFLDGRAGETFVDPADGSTVLMATGAALETQAVEPIVNAVEMAKDGRTWADVISKLGSVTPLALARFLPSDTASAITASPSYPQLFAAAFGDPEITAARIAMAIASYERTLIPNQSPWDLYMAGDQSAMTDMQINGWELLRDQTVCTNCHTPPLFTDNLYWNIGVRPAVEDAGRMEVTAIGTDYGRFKTATLRNVGLRISLMHNGQMFSTQDAIDFYMANHHSNRHTQFAEFQSGIPLGDGEITDDYSGAHVHMLTPEGEPLQMPVLAFLNTALTDPRAASETFPFDRPLLASESAAVVGVQIGIESGNEGGTIHPQHDGGLDGSTRFNDEISVVVYGSSISSGDSSDFNAGEIDPDTIRFGPGRGATDPASISEFDIDIDSDGDPDARFHFLTGDTDVACTDTEATLEGRTITGQPFSGADTIVTACDAHCH